MDDFRNQLYQDNPGTQVVFVQRDDFCTQVLGVYKNPAFNLLQKPQIIFAGEAGTRRTNSKIGQTYYSYS